MSDIVSYYAVDFVDGRPQAQVSAIGLAQDENDHIFTLRDRSEQRFSKAEVKEINCTGFEPFLV